MPIRTETRGSHAGDSVTATDDRTQPAPGRASVRLEIDELVLHGFPTLDRHGVADALEAELTRLLSDQGTPDGWRQAAQRDLARAASIQLPWAVSPGELGRALARAIYERGDAR